MREDAYTDITFEIFNSCGGSCTGCMLSAAERTTYKLNNLDGVLSSLSKISAYGKANNIKYRVVFSFGDVPKMPWIDQMRIYQTCVYNELAFGITATLTDEDFDYKSVLRDIISLHPNCVFDITIDPIRLGNKKFDGYRKNLLMALKMAKKLHLQVLLSSAVMDRFTPSELVASLSEVVGNRSVFLGFSPTLANINSKNLNYSYSFRDAVDYAKAFYSVNKGQEKFLNDEVIRAKTHGEYLHFIKSVFHINQDLDVFPQIYTIFGDLIQDKRNSMFALGNLSKSPLSEILSESKLQKINIKNNLFLESSTIGCIDCNFLESCRFNGIGSLRGIYKGNEERVGLCYGPRTILG